MTTKLFPKFDDLIQTPVAALIANEYLERINFVDLINSKVSWDQLRWNTSPGVLAKAVVLSTFYETRSPLSQIAERFLDSDTEFLFGNGVKAAHLNDDALAACLDRIAQVDAEKVFSTLSLSAYSKFDLDMSCLHSDTSNLVLYGDYEMCNDENYNGVCMNHGHSKANRPDKKQVSVGKIVNKQGVVLISKTLDGNVADCEWNKEAITLLKDVLGEKLRTSIYTADCKLVTMPNIHLFCDKTSPVQFISRCPSSFYNKIAEKLVAEAYLDNNWSAPLSLGEKDSYARYRLQSYTKTIEKEKLRFIVVETTSKKGLIEKRLEREKIAFEASAKPLTKQIFACQKDAEQALALFCKKNKNKLWTLKAGICSKEIVKKKRGRHSPEQEAQIESVITTWHIQIDSIEQHPDNVVKATQQSLTFVLITNVSTEKLDDEKVLFTYKGQAVVEVQFHLLKKPCLAATIFLKKPERIDALMMLLNVALLIRGLMQFQARENLKKMDTIPNIGINGQKFDKPTSENMLLLLRNHFILLHKKKRYHSPCTDKIGHRLTTLLYLLDIEERLLFEK